MTRANKKRVITTITNSPHRSTTSSRSTELVEEKSNYAVLARKPFFLGLPSSSTLDDPAMLVRSLLGEWWVCCRWWRVRCGSRHR
ncbi:hypothetical protein KCU65_g121, partial [Aureobasidium melanogenum]